MERKRQSTPDTANYLSVSAGERACVAALVLSQSDTEGRMMFSRGFRCVIVWFPLLSFNLNTASKSIISGPFPLKETRAISSTAEFTCEVNTTQLNGRFFSIIWNLDGIIVSSTMGVLRSSTITLTATEENLSGIAIQCSVILNPFSQIDSGNSLLIIYGPPQAVSNLTTKPAAQSSTGNALILSWSAPSSPVQLHYTVTVNTSTTTITVTNDTNITITREEVMAAINSTECDIYAFSVTAINPAGSSIPANLTTPVTFVPDLHVNVSTVGSTLYIKSATDISNVNVSVQLVNSCADEVSYTDKMHLHAAGNNLWTFNITDLQNWTNITVVAENQCRSVSVTLTVNTNKCTPAAATTTTTPTVTMTTMSLPVWVTALAVVLALVVLVTVAVTMIAVGFCLCRKKLSKTCSFKGIESGSDEKYESLEQDKEYMTPADAHKEVKLLGKQQSNYTTPADAHKNKPLSDNKIDDSPRYVTFDALEQTNSSQGASQTRSINKAPCVVQQPAVPEYATPSVQHHTQQQVQDTPLYSDVFETQKANSLRSSQRKNNANKPHTAPSLPPPTTATDEYSSLQQHQVVDQDQHVYDSAQGDLPQYSTIAQQKTKYTDLQFSPDTGLEILGNTSSTVQYSVVGDTTNMEYSVVGPKTASSKDCPPPPPPSAEVVHDMLNS